MRFLIKRLALGFVLIVLSATVLLVSDLGHRTAAARTKPHIALLQHASTLLLDEGTRGAIDALDENGFVEGKTIDIDKFNAHGDISIGNSIAKQMVNAHYDLLLTMSTLSLQAVANANRGTNTVHVFAWSPTRWSQGWGSVATIPWTIPESWLELAVSCRCKTHSTLRKKCFRR
jgi:ABC-type uncharacterized transport system substrate-binding protein